MPIGIPPPLNVTDTPASGTIPAQAVRIVPDDEPEKYLTVRLSNGATFYNAGGTSISGGTGITSDQGAPGLVSAAWPIKVTDGSNVYGPVGVPFNVVLSSGSIGLGTTDVGGSRVLKTDLVQSVALTVTAQSGSVAGLLQGGQAVSMANPIPITGSVYVLNQGGAGSNVTSQSGSVTGLLVGGMNLSNANPVPISDAGGTITVDGAVTVASTVINTGSVSGLLVGGQALSNANPVPISDAGGTLTVDGTVSVTQGTAAGIGSPWPVILVSGSDPVGTATHPTWVTGSVFVLNPGAAASTVTALSASLVGLQVGGVPLSNANPIPISDAGGTITVDGTVTATVASTVINSGSLAGLLVGGVSLSNANPLPISDAGGALTVDGTVIVSSATVISGSVVGNLVGGQPVSNANPFPVSDAGSSLTVDGTVTVTQGTAAGIGSPWPVILVSGSDPVGTQTHPTWVTGSVFVLNPGGAASNVITTTGSITGLLQGGQAVSNANPVPISDAGGTITVDGTVVVASTVINSGSVAGILIGGQALSNANPAPVSDGGSSLTVDGTVTTTQGTAAGLGAPWPVILVSGSDAVGTITHPTWVTGSVFVLNPGAAASTVTSQSGSVTGLLVGGVNVANSNPVPISDAGGSLTIDGTVIVASTVINTGSITGLLQGGQAVSNANPIPISDAGGTITVDGSVTATVASTVINSGSVSGLLIGGVNLSNANPVPISDAGGAITVDGTVTSIQGTAAGLGAPWPVILVSGSDAVGTTTKPMWVTGSVFVLNPGSAASNVTTISASVMGHLVGGVALSNANPFPISDAGGSLTIDGTVTVASTVINSGSITGLLVGGLNVANSNPIPISDAGGSLTIDGTVTVASTVINSGSITGLLVGGVNVANANPVPISDAGGSLTVDGTATVTQGTAAALGAPWTVLLVSGSDTLGHPAKGLHATAADRTGMMYQDNTQRAVSFAQLSPSGSGNSTILAAQGASNRIRVLSAHIMTSGSLNVKFLSSTTTDISGLYPCRDGGGFVLPYNPHGWFQTAANEALNINLSSAIPTGVTITYIVVT